MLPNSDSLTGYDEIQLSTALGHVTHLVQMLSVFLQVPNRYPVTVCSSRSRIIDHASQHEEVDTQRELVSSFLFSNKILKLTKFKLFHFLIEGFLCSQKAKTGCISNTPFICSIKISLSCAGSAAKVRLTLQLLFQICLLFCSIFEPHLRGSVSLLLFF